MRYFYIEMIIICKTSINLFIHLELSIIYQLFGNRGGILYDYRNERNRFSKSDT